MDTLSRSLTAMVAVSLVTGCGVFQSTGPRTPIASITQDASRMSAYVAGTDKGCPVTGEVTSTGQAPAAVPLVGLIGALAPIAADFIVGAISAELERAKTELNGQWVAMGPVKIEDGNCLVLVRAPLGDSGKYKQAEGSKIDAKIAKDLGLAGPPTFYLEAAVTQDGDQEGRFLFQTKYQEYGDTAAIRRGKGEKEVAVVFALRQSPLAADATKENVVDGAAAVIPLGLGRLKIGTSPGVGGERYKDQGRVFALVDSEGKPLTGSVNAVALVSESEDASVALKVLSKAFENNKDGLQEAIVDIIKSATGGADEKKS